MMNFIFSIGLKLIDMYMKRKVRDEKMIKSYYTFLDQVDKAGLANVANYMAAEDALAAKQQEIRERLEREKKNGST